MKSLEPYRCQGLVCGHGKETYQPHSELLRHTDDEVELVQIVEEQAKIEVVDEVQMLVDLLELDILIVHLKYDIIDELLEHQLCEVDEVVLEHHDMMVVIAVVYDDADWNLIYHEKMFIILHDEIDEELSVVLVHHEVEYDDVLIPAEQMEVHHEVDDEVLVVLILGIAVNDEHDIELIEL